MTHLDNFTKEQRDMLVALPYRVGLWISASDSSGGNDADSAELDVLTTIITSFSEDFCKSEFAQALLEETTARRDEWPEWSGNLEDVPGECQRCIDLLAERLERKEVTSFKFNLMEIATDVAMAYREFSDNRNLAYRMQVYLRIILGRLKGDRARSMDEYLNISISEQRALDRLAVALDIGNARAGITVGQTEAA